ncbi:golgin subfamily A member 5-like [Ruditapes philippinarum]|uniref:golgin subfamily A member 5-like n=1 Tax=Ruditapes philippinarum TaxID=129788 RepID=UPI00295C32E8|nr:golgin subfamily A member 5-like [Ruditapes philippinarum]
MCDAISTKRDSVAELLTQLKRGNTITDNELKDAVAYHQSFVMELQSYKDIADFNHATPKADCRQKDIQHELDDLKKEHQILGQELKYYRDQAKHAEQTNAESLGNQRHLTKGKEDHENVKRMSEHLTAKLRESETEIKKCKCALNKLQAENDEAKNEIKRLTLERNKAVNEPEKGEVLTELEASKNACRKLQDELHQLKLDHSKSQDKGQSKALEKLRQQNDQLNEDNKKLMGQMHELRNRLSVIAGHKLTDGNPGIADLSDAFRPTKIAEHFRQLYDNEWTRAFEEHEVKFKHEEEIIDFLAGILKDIDRFCARAGSQQLENLKFSAKSIIRDPEYQPDAIGERKDKILKCTNSACMTSAQEELADKLLKDFRKSLGMISKAPLLMIFRQVSPLIKDKIGSTASDGLYDFLEKAFELIWVMKMQDPPMEFVWSKPGDNFDKNMYTHYTRRGSKVSQCIWPAVVLHKAGPLMSKGVVQGN